MAIDDIRITRGQARYGRLQRLRAWLYHRAPWLPRWVTGWTTWHFRRPEVPFPASPRPVPEKVLRDVEARLEEVQHGS